MSILSGFFDPSSPELPLPFLRDQAARYDGFVVCGSREDGLSLTETQPPPQLSVSLAFLWFSKLPPLGDFSWKPVEADLHRPYLGLKASGSS